MNIAIDFDGTYTLAPKTWDKVVKRLKKDGNNVYLVTHRTEDAEEDNDDIYKSELWMECDGAFFTNGKKKAKFMLKKGIHIDVWIDNYPRHIV